MYKLNVMSYTLATISRALVAVAGYMGSGNVTLMLLFTAVAALGQGPWQGDKMCIRDSCTPYLGLKSFSPDRNGLYKPTYTKNSCSAYVNCVKWPKFVPLKPVSYTHL